MLPNYEPNENAAPMPDGNLAGAPLDANANSEIAPANKRYNLRNKRQRTDPIEEEDQNPAKRTMPAKEEVIERPRTIGTRPPQKGLKMKGQAKYRHIDKNVYRINSTKRSGSDHCFCDESGGDCSDFNCLNVATETECPKDCKANNCQNQKISKKIFKKTEIFDTGSRGFGCKASEVIQPGEIIGEYTGEVHNEEQAETRRRRYKEEGRTSNYMMETTTTDPRELFYVDATLLGNNMRFINHSCDPNTTFARIKVPRTKGDVFHTIVKGIKLIEDGEEITVNYGYGKDHPMMLNCLCKKCLKPSDPSSEMSPKTKETKTKISKVANGGVQKKAKSSVKKTAPRKSASTGKSQTTVSSSASRGLSPISRPPSPLPSSSSVAPHSLSQASSSSASCPSPISPPLSPVSRAQSPFSSTNASFQALRDPSPVSRAPSPVPFSGFASPSSHVPALSDVSPVAEAQGQKKKTSTSPATKSRERQATRKAKSLAPVSAKPVQVAQGTLPRVPKSTTAKSGVKKVANRGQNKKREIKKQEKKKKESKKVGAPQRSKKETMPAPPPQPIAAPPLQDVTAMDLDDFDVPNVPINLPNPLDALLQQDMEFKVSIGDLVKLRRRSPPRRFAPY